MTNYYDLIALCVVTIATVTGAAYVATQPTKPSKREELEKELLAKLEKVDEWMHLNSGLSTLQEGVKRAEILQLETVALLEAIPERHLVRGQVGTVLQVLERGAVLVEFARAEDGVEIATVAVDSSKLLKLCHELAEENKLPGGAL